MHSPPHVNNDDILNDAKDNAVVCRCGYICDWNNTNVLMALDRNVMIFSGTSDPWTDEDHINTPGITISDS